MSLNRCDFIGRLGKDPELITTQNGAYICKFNIAVDNSYKSKTGEKIKKTEWIRCSTFSKLAEICNTYLKKASQVYISGRYQTSEYTNKDGVLTKSVEIVVEKLTMLDTKKLSDHQTPDDAGNKLNDDFNDEIPF